MHLRDQKDDGKFFERRLRNYIYGCMFCTLVFNFCKLCIFIVMFMYSYCYVRSVLCILFSLCRSVYFLCVNVCYPTDTTAVAQCLRRCATNRKVAGSIPDDFIGIFH